MRVLNNLKAAEQVIQNQLISGNFSFEIPLYDHSACFYVCFAEAN